MKKIKNFLAVCIFLFAFMFINVTFADVGNINRYSTDSSSNNSSSNIGKTSSNLSNDFDGSGGSIGTIIIVGIIFIVILYFFGKSKGMIKGYKDIADISKMKNVYNELKKIGEDSLNTSNSNVDGLEEEISKYDPYFSREKFMSWVSDVFIKLQTAWTKRDWKIIRPFESNELFEQHSAQLQEYIDNNKINVMERISIVESDIADHRIEGDKEIIEVWLCADLRDYIIDATTKEVIEGDKNRDYRMMYRMTFYRKYGTKTKEGTSNMSTTNCPNCGAPTEITSAGQCKYCDSVITTGDHDWVLSKLEGEPDNIR